MDKKNLNKKLKSYGAIATGVIAIGNVAQAQVVYTNLNPDEIITGDGTSYLLDLDNDGVKDYRIVTISSTSSSTSSQYTVKAAGVYPLNQNEILVGTSTGSSSSGTYIKALNKNEQIDANQVIWSGTTSAFMLAGGVTGTAYGIPFTYQFGAWDGVTDKYMAVKFDISGNTHYGWVRMDVNSTSDTVVVKGFAYNATPNTPIKAGDIGVGFGDEPLNLDNIKISAHQNIVTIDAEGIKNNNSELFILDAMGRELKRMHISNGRTEVALDVAAGVYFVNIRSGEAILSEKVIIE